MVPSLKSEFRKLLTVRSTYLVTGLVIFLTSLFTYLGTTKTYEDVQKPAQQQSQQAASDSDKSANKQEVRAEPKLTSNLPKEKLLLNLQDSVIPVSIFIGIVVILLMGHEFRYNTITYTLTSSNRRSKVFASKIIASATYVVVAALLAFLATIAATYVAVSIKGLYLPPQDLNWVYLFARYGGYILGYSLFGLAIITLIRNLTAGIVALLFLPTLENIVASIMQSQNIEAAKYLPYTVLGRVGDIVNSGVLTIQVESRPVTVPGAVAITAIYVVGVLAVAWYLFLRRDAT